MYSRLRTLAFLAIGGFCAAPLHAQSGPPIDAAPAAVDRLFRIGGVVPSGPGNAAGGVETIGFAIYDSETGGTILWQELQTVTVDSQGRYSVLLGSMSTEGLPLELFASGEPRWLATHVQRQGQTEQPRSLLTSVPYALRAAKASDADTLGGRPASAYLLSPSARGDAAASTRDGSSEAALRASGSAHRRHHRPDRQVRHRRRPGRLRDVRESAGRIGVGTTTPLDLMHARFNDTYRSLHGLRRAEPVAAPTPTRACCSTTSSATLGQFQGFNNSTHEYRINNIAASGSINFMTASDSKFKIINNGNIGLGSGTFSPNVRLQNYGNSVADVTIFSLRHGGTIAAPTATGNGANLIRLEGGGHTGSGFTTERGFLQVVSTEAWTATANGTEVNFGTTANGTTSPVTRMSILNDGDVEVAAANEAGKLMVGPTVGGSTFSGNLGVTGDGNGIQGVAVIDRLNNDGILVRFRRNGITQGSIDVAAGVVTYNAFTGSHYARTDEVIERGMLVSLTGENSRLEDNPSSEILYGVTKSQQPNDPAVMGAYLARQNPAAANLANSVNPHLVEAVGNGEMLVIDTGRDLAAGDYLVSSAVAGHAMTDPGTFDVSNVVARVAEPIDWSHVTETVRGADGREHKRALASVFFESFVIDRTRNAATDAELVSLRSEVANLTTQLAALESMLKTLTTTVQQQR